MTGFHWTGLEVGALTIVGATLAAMAWMQWEKRRDERESAEAARESAARVERRSVEREHLFLRQAAEVVALAEYFCRYSAHEQGLSLFAEHAEQYPMPQRPAPPTAAPGEPWQQHVKNNTLEPGLVEPGASDDNPQVER